jgi:hypothetical protein
VLLGSKVVFKGGFVDFGPNEALEFQVEEVGLGGELKLVI